MTKMSDKKKEILEQIDELSKLQPEDEYQKEVSNDNPEDLEKARKKLMLMINIKCKGVGQDVILGQIKPMVYSMKLSDCDNMCMMIKKKGMFGLPLMLKKRTDALAKG